MLCGYCLYGAPLARIPAVLVINGQSVCEEHVDAACYESPDFSRSLIRVQDGKA